MSHFVERPIIKANTQNKLNRALYGTWFNAGLPIPSGYNFTEDLIAGYMDNEVIYSVVNKIADTASSVPMRVEDLEGNELDKHWITQLIKRPNEDTTIKELIFNYYVFLLAIGNSFIYTPRLGDGRSIELYTMPSDIVEIVAGNWRHPIQGYKVMEGSDKVSFKKSEVMHGKLFNPRYGADRWLYGLSPINVAAEVIRGINAGNKRMAMLAETGGPSYLISAQLTEGLTEAQQEMLEDTYDRKYTQPENAGKPMLSGTPLKVEQLGSNAADLELIKASEHSLRVICNVYGVSSILFNDNENSTFNNVNQVRKDFYQYTIQPLNQALAEKLKYFLAPDEDIVLKFDYSNVEVLQESIYVKIEGLEKADFLTSNEKRAELGFEPLEEIIPNTETNEG